MCVKTYGKTLYPPAYSAWAHTPTNQQQQKTKCTENLQQQHPRGTLGNTALLYILSRPGSYLPNPFLHIS